MRQMGSMRSMRSMRRLRGLGGRAALAIVGQGENFEFWILNWGQAVSSHQRGESYTIQVNNSMKKTACANCSNGCLKIKNNDN